jgi:hypothetical protein
VEEGEEVGEQLVGEEEGVRVENDKSQQYDES